MAGVGTIFARALRSVGIRYETSDKCNCYALMVRMDKSTPDDIEANIDYWNDECQKSAQQWFHARLEDGKYMTQALRPAARAGIRPLLLWSCNKARG